MGSARSPSARYGGNGLLGSIVARSFVLVLIFSSVHRGGARELRSLRGDSGLDREPDGSPRSPLARYAGNGRGALEGALRFIVDRWALLPGDLEFDAAVPAPG